MYAATRPEPEYTLAGLLTKVSEIAAMPQVVYKILELTGSTATSAQAIEDAISLDPGFSSKVLILANSAFYALPRRVTSIREAATFMGYKTIRQLAMTVGVFDMFVGKNDSGSLRRRAWWRHSVDAAVCAKTIAKHVNGVDPEDAYSCALLHDVGKSLLDRATHGEYAMVEALILDGLSPSDAERQVFGCTHAELGSAAAQRWNLPKMIVDSIGMHHGNVSGDFVPHVAVTCISSEFAHQIVEGKKLQHVDSQSSDEEETTGPKAWASDWAREVLSLDDENLNRIYNICKTAIAERSGMAL